MRLKLRAASFIAVVVGALGSVGLTLYAGRHNDSRLLVALFTLWVLSPFIAVLIASRRWWAFARRPLYGVSFILTPSSLAVYLHPAWRPPGSGPAFVFLVVPLASWLLLTMVVVIAALVSGVLSRRDAGV
jgi:hypothetical protein